MWSIKQKMGQSVHRFYLVNYLRDNKKRQQNIKQINLQLNFWVGTFSGLSEEGNMADNAEIFHSFQMQCLIDKSQSSFTAFKIKTFAHLYGQLNKVFKSTMGLLLGNIFYNSRR